jgi:hypothetical protein
MSLPMPANTTCDIYHANNAPPASPDVAGVKCFLMAHGQSTLTSTKYTHVLYVDATVDIRDNYDPPTMTSPIPGGATSGETVYVPDKTGTAFTVVLVRRFGRGTAFDHKRVLLLRQAVTWPSNNV